MTDLVINQKSTNTDNLVNSEGGNIKDVKEFKVGAGSGVTYTDKYGTRWGSISFDTAKAWIKTDGSFKFKADDGSILIDSNSATGDYIQIINSSLNTASKKILTDFTFETTDYQGAFKTGNPTWDTTTGLPTGGTGVIINGRGIMSVGEGVITFTLDASNGNATFAGTLAAPSGTLGTITAGTITGATIQTAATGYRVKMSTAGLQFLSAAVVKGSIGTDAYGSMVYYSSDNHYFRDGTTELAEFNSNGLNLPSGKKLSFSGGGSIKDEGSQLHIEGATGGTMNLKIEGHCYPNSDGVYDLGSGDKFWRTVYGDNIRSGNFVSGDGSNGVTVEDYFVTEVRVNENQARLEKKSRKFTFKDGIITAVGSETGWTDSGNVNP